MLRSLTTIRVPVPTVRSTIARQGRASLQVQSNYIWTLKAKRQTDKSKDVDLTTYLKKSRECCVASHDLAEEISEPVDLTICASGGTQLRFTCEGEHPVDRPKDLYVTDLKSDVVVKVDGEVVEKGKKYHLHPGAILQIGDDEYEVDRNVFAHA